MLKYYLFRNRSIYQQGHIIDILVSSVFNYKENAFCIYDKDTDIESTWST